MDARNSFWIVFVIWSFGWLQFADCASEYIGAVAEHLPITEGTVAQRIAQNLQKYAAQVATASQHGAQIIAFPEFGLTNIDIFYVENSRAAVTPYCEIVPNLQNTSHNELNPCLNPVLYADRPILSNISCLARKHKMVVVMNMYDLQPCAAQHGCPSDGKYQFNADVVFDESGTIIAKYYKTHVWFTDAFDAPPNPQLVTFTTSFGVTFGLFICYDIAFDFPGPELVKQGIRHFPYVAAQGIVGPELVETWSYFYGATMLFSNMGDTDSGIYVNGTTIQHTVINNDQQGNDKTYIATIPI